MTDRVLVAEPDPHLQRALLRVIRATGYEVIGTDALPSPTETRGLRALIVDEVLLEAPAAEFGAVPTVVLTSGRLAPFGEAVWLTKPFDGKALTRALVTARARPTLRRTA